MYNSLASITSLLCNFGYFICFLYNSQKHNLIKRRRNSSGTVTWKSLKRFWKDNEKSLNLFPPKVWPPCLHQRKQSSRVLRPNWNAVQWPRVSGKDVTSRTSCRRCLSGFRPKWWGRTENWHWTNRGIPLRLAEKYTSLWGSYIFRLFTTGSEVCCGAGRPSRRWHIWSCQCAHLGDVPSQRFAFLPGYQCYTVRPFSIPVWSTH